MATMSVATFKQVAPMIPIDTSTMLRGPHGIGKSQLGRWYAASTAVMLGIAVEDYEVIDRRLSQCSEGDVLGLPSTDGEVTRFNPPDWFKRACSKPCFLFLDELNRASPEVMQAAFQIVLDRELNGWKLHPQTRVMTAVNNSAQYNVNEMDPALLDRFWTVDLVPTADDWRTWAREENKAKGYGRNCEPGVVEFLSQEDKWLDPPATHEPGAVLPSRRSWERLGDALYKAKIHESPTDPRFYALALGYVGTEASIRFTDFSKSIDNRFTAEDILERFTKKDVQRKVVERKSADVFNDAIDKVATHTKDFKNLTDAQGKNLGKFFEALPHELRITLWARLTAGGTTRVDFIKAVHHHCVKHVMDIFGVPMGEAGIGVMPNIPGTLKNPPDKK